MNSIRASLVPLLLVASVAGVLVRAGDFKADLEQLADTDNGPAFDEDQDNFDKHADIFYYTDANVAREYSRANYLATQVTLAGQAVDYTDRPVKPAVNPFAVAQRTFKKFGTLQDRWDVKDNGKDTQFFALYHGKGGDYVVNKLRAHLLRQLANAVGDQLPSLDRTAEEDAEEHPDLVQEVQDKFRATVEQVVREVDNDIRRSMPDKDDSRASATVVIVSKNFITTVSAGRGSVIGYGLDYEPNVLVDHTGEDEHDLFGLKKSRQESIQPRVQFFSRIETSNQFLLIETPAVANTVPARDAVQAVLNSITANGDEQAKEQELYSSAVINIIDQIATTLSAFQRFFLHSDYSIVLVGLDTEYENIH